MREKGFEPLQALSYLVLSQARLTTPAFPLIKYHGQTCLNLFRRKNLGERFDFCYFIKLISKSKMRVENFLFSAFDLLATSLGYLILLVVKFVLREIARSGISA